VVTFPFKLSVTSKLAIEDAAAEQSNTATTKSFAVISLEVVISIFAKFAEPFNIPLLELVAVPFNLFVVRFNAILEEELIAKFVSFLTANVPSTDEAKD